MKGYAILYKKEKIENKDNMWILRPIKVVKTVYNKENNKYKISNKIISSIDDVEAIKKDEKVYIGSVFGENSKVYDKKIANTLSLNTLITNIILLGKIENNEVVYNPITLDYSSVPSLNKYDYIDRTTENIIEGFKYYNDLIDSMGNDITVLTEDEVGAILSSKTRNELIDLVTFFSQTKEIYIAKSKKSSKTFMIPDAFLFNALEIADLEEIKKEIEGLIEFEFAKPITQELTLEKEIEKEENADDDEIIKNSILLNDIFFETLFEVNSIDVLRSVLTAYKESFNEKNEVREEMRRLTPKTLVYYDETSKALDNILKLDDINEMKRLLKEFHSEQLNLIMNSELEEFIECNSKEKYKFNYIKVRDILVSRIIGRDRQIDRILSMIDKNDNLKDKSKRESMIIAGTTGTGKTKTFYELKKVLNKIRPVIIVDTTQLTEVGFKGGNIDDFIIVPLIQEAHDINKLNGITQSDSIAQEDIELAKHGIVVLDEIDKKASRGDDTSVSTEGVVNELLKLFDPGTTYPINYKNTFLQFDTSCLTFLIGGAFQEYFDRKVNNSIGFNNSSNSNEDEYSKYKEVDPSELVNYGLNVQFVGRITSATLYEPHNIESLIELENNRSTSNLQANMDLFKNMNIDFVWENGYIEEVAKRAYEEKTGGRALNNLINRSLDGLYTEVIKRKNQIKTIFVPVKAIEDSKNIILIDNNNEPMLLGNLMEETEKRYKKLRLLNRVSLNEGALKEAEEIYKTKVLKK